MWKREQLKTRAKAALKKNYWKMVLVGAIMTFLLGGTAGSPDVANLISWLLGYSVSIRS